MKRSLLFITTTAILVLPLALTGAADGAPEADFLTAEVSEDGIEIADSAGGKVDVVDQVESDGQQISYVRDASGTIGLVLELDWLRRAGTETKADPLESPVEVADPSTLDDFGNSTTTIGFTAEETRVPDDVERVPFAAVASTESAITVAINPDFASTGKVLRDGKQVGELVDGKFTETSLPSGSTFAYAIESDGSAGDDVSLSFNATTVAAYARAQDLDVESTSYAVTQSINNWYHATYIPGATVATDPLSWTGCGGATAFSGDNRGDTYPTLTTWPSHRTAVMVTTNWGNPYPYQLYYSPSVGQTKKIVNGAVVATATASYDGIELLDTWVTGGVSHFDIHHDVGNPFCAAGSIKYRETVQFWQSGVVAVNGRHNNVPRHESYATFNPDTLGNQVFRKVWNWSTADFSCLVGLE